MKVFESAVLADSGAGWRIEYATPRKSNRIGVDLRSLRPIVSAARHLKPTTALRISRVETSVCHLRHLRSLADRGSRHLRFSGAAWPVAAFHIDPQIDADYTDGA